MRYTLVSTMANSPVILLPLLLLSSVIARTESLPAGDDERREPATQELDIKEFTVEENATQIVSVDLPDGIDINTTVVIEYEIGDAEKEPVDKFSLCKGKADILKCWMDMESSGNDIDGDDKDGGIETSSGNIHFSVGYAENHLKDFNVFVTGSKVGSICLDTLTTAFVDMDIKGSNESSLNLLITSHINGTKIVKIGNIYNSDVPCAAAVIPNNDTDDLEENNNLNILLNNIDRSSNNVTDDNEEQTDLNNVVELRESINNGTLGEELLESYGMEGSSHIEESAYNKDENNNSKVLLDSIDEVMNRRMTFGNTKKEAESCSTESGASCQFPFIWEGLEHSGCIPGSGGHHMGQDQHWCSTKVDGEGVHVEGYSAICNQDCPFDTMGYFFGQAGLTEVKASVQKWEGTDDEVSIHLLDGWKGASCKTGWLNQRQGWDVDNWSNGDTEVYTQSLGDCTNFKSNGTAFAFKMIVSNQKSGWGNVRFWSDQLCLDKMEFIVQATKYTWEPTKEEKDKCWENSQGPVKIATKSNL